MSDEIFSSAYKKLNYCKKKLEKIRSISTVLPRDFYKIRIEISKKVVKFNEIVSYCLVYDPQGSISEEIGELVADFVVNLRSSLDHFAYRSMSYFTGKSPRDFVFPAATERGDMLCHSALGKLEEAIPGSRDLIKNVIRPKDDEYGKYWSFASMANEEKHRDCIPIVHAIKISGLSCKIERFGHDFINDCSFSFDTTKSSRLISVPYKFIVHGNAKINIESRFGSNNLLAGEGVLESLEGMLGVVESTLTHFEAKLKSRSR